MKGRDSWMHTPCKLIQETTRARNSEISLELPPRKKGYAHCEGCNRYAYAGGRVNKGWRCAGCKSIELENRNAE